LISLLANQSRALTFRLLTLSYYGCQRQAGDGQHGKINL
jgi:hypothetical protein